MASFLKRSKSKEKEWNAAEKEQLMSIDFAQGFNKTQQDAIAQMKTVIGEKFASASKLEGFDEDLRLLRFLRGHKLDIQTACQMYSDMLDWRELYKTDQIRNDIIQNSLKPEDFPHHGRILRYYPSHMHYSTDREGRPLYIELLGRVDPKKVMSAVDEAEWLRHHVYCMEYTSWLTAKLSKEQKSLVRIVLLYDLHGLSTGHLKKSGLDMLRKTLKITQDYYPESMHKCLLLNAPKVFTMAWSVIKPWLAERTVKKVSVLGTNFKKQLLEIATPESLPVSLGGTRADQFPLVFDKKGVADFDNEYQCVEVSKGSDHVLKIPLKSNSFVVWGLYAKSGDISTHVYGDGISNVCTEGQEEQEESKDQDDQGCTVFKAERIEACGGSFETIQDGELVIHLDNSFSWMSKKTIHYYTYQVAKKNKSMIDSPRNGKLSSFF